MRIVTQYKTNANGRGQIVAKSGGKQKTISYDSVYSSETNHGHAAGALIAEKFPESIPAWQAGGEHDSNDSGTVHTFTV